MIMDNKFYVSYEAARLLKEKGYNEKCTFAYTDVSNGSDINGRIVFNSNDYPVGIYPCPTKAEAIDWLESKGMRINIIYDWIECKWYFTIINGSPTVKNITELEVSDSVFYKTRLDAEEAAIIEACKLLENGN